MSGAHNTAREVMGAVEHSRPAGAKNRIHHAGDDRFKPIADHGEPHAVHYSLASPSARTADRLESGCGSITIVPLLRRLSRAPGSRTIVVVGVSTMAGPSITSSKAISSMRQTGTRSVPGPEKYTSRFRELAGTTC